MNRDELSRLLMADRSRLTGFVRRHGGICLKHESEEDLVQGVAIQALAAAERFTYRSRPEFEAWTIRIARAFIADRRDYWTAAKRGPERLLRLTRSDSDTADPAAAREPMRDTPGPATRADREDQMRLAEEALALLLPRDMEFVRGIADGRSIDEDAARLGISRAAAQRARLRAQERFRKAFKILARGS